MKLIDRAIVHIADLVLDRVEARRKANVLHFGGQPVITVQNVADLERQMRRRGKEAG